MDDRFKQTRRTLVMGIALCMVAVGIAGCEVNSSSSYPPVTISPAVVSLKASQPNTIKFTASGGNSNYTWSLSDNSLGTFYTDNTSTNGTAFYENNTTNSAGTVTLTVTDTSNDTSGNSAIATITQLP